MMKYNNKTKVLFLPVQEGLGGSGVYRMTLPAIHLNKGNKINAFTEIANYVSPDMIDAVDMVVIQRPASAGILRIIDYCYKEGKKIIVDVDDLLTAVPDWNPASVAYPQENLTIHKEILKMADLVTVTTHKLKDKLQKIARRVEVLPNCVDFELYDECATTQVSRDNRIRILWTGSNTHQKDFEVIEDIMIRLFEKYNITFVIYGQFPEIIKQLKFKNYLHSNIEYWGMTPFTFYYPTLYRINADIGVAPLLDIKFNHHKSPLKILEYGMTGLSVVVSDVYPYNFVIDNEINGYLVNNTNGNWYNRLCELIEDGIKRKEMATRLHDKIKSEYNIKTMIHKWEDVYLSLMGDINLEETKREKLLVTA